MTRLRKLTRRQLQVAVLYTDTNLPVASIARRLGIAESTAHQHITEVNRRLGTVSRSHLRSVMLECELAAGGVR